ncbi:MAG TPA: phosphoribosylformylglycinamidine synthase subunit PurS [Rubricoccaceae bacterium]|jgi:phosphoribosylformylglycinamidine synthase
MYHAIIRITLRPSILDPQGQAVQRALHALDLPLVQAVRTGKHVELTLDTDSAEEAQAAAERACRLLLANPVTEDYEVLALLPGEGRRHESGVAANVAAASV